MLDSLLRERRVLGGVFNSEIMNTTSAKFDLLALLEKNIAKYGGVATSDAENSIQRGKSKTVKGDKNSEDIFSKRKKCKHKADRRIISLRANENVDNYTVGRIYKEQENDNDTSSSSLGCECVLTGTKTIDNKIKATTSTGCDDEDKHRVPDNKSICNARKNQKCNCNPQILLPEEKKEPIIDNIKEDDFINVMKVEPTKAKFEYTECDNKVSDNVNSYPILKPMSKGMSVDLKNEDICDNVEDKSFVMQLLRKSVAKVTSMTSTENNVKEMKVICNKIDKQMGDKITCPKNIQMTNKSDARRDEPDKQDERIDGRRKFARRKYHNLRQFTLEEDDVILDAIKKYGDHINLAKLSKQIGRSRRSVDIRMKKLKTGERSRKQKRLFSLEEDLLIMDRILPHLDRKLLKDLVFNYTDATIQELATLLSRDVTVVNHRWATVLHSWILQYLSGTLNYDIRRMLVNHLADTFSNKDDIDWPLVASKPEFVGHTEESLRYRLKYTVVLVRKYKNTNNEEITLRQIADGANEYFTLKQTKVPQRILTRQAQVIDYFEQYRKKHNLTNIS